MAAPDVEQLFYQIGKYNNNHSLVVNDNAATDYVLKLELEKFLNDKDKFIVSDNDIIDFLNNISQKELEEAKNLREELEKEFKENESTISKLKKQDFIICARNMIDFLYKIKCNSLEEIKKQLESREARLEEKMKNMSNFLSRLKVDEVYKKEY